MKKRNLLILCLVIAAMLAGCGSSASDGRKDAQGSGVNDVLASGMAEADKENAEKSSPASGAAETEENGSASESIEETSEAEEAAPSSSEEAAPSASGEDASSASGESSAPVLSTTEGIDIDLTLLSSTMVYSEVYNMMYSASDYLGKTIKMRGAFSYYHSAPTDTYYFACIIQDATACCSQGIEFVLAGDYHYPEDYPEVGEEITVVGTFGTYQEGEYTYYTLKDASFV